MGLDTRQTADLPPTAPPTARFALVMAGGGARGAYEAGVLHWLIDELPGRLGRPIHFDIVTGITAIPVALLTVTRRTGRLVVAAWNVLGLFLLVNIVTIAILATPRFRYFGEGHLNVWVTYPPFVWLPAVLVLAALAGHLLIFRALAAAPASRADGTHQVR